MNRTTYIIVILGIIGAIVFTLLRPQVDFNAEGSIQKNVTEIGQEMEKLALQLGFSMDSLALSSIYQQHGAYVDMLRDSVDPGLTPAMLNERGGHIQGWANIIGRPESMNGVIVGAASLFRSAGQLEIIAANAGKVIRLASNEDFNNPTFVQGDSLEHVAEKVVQDIFGYPLQDYARIENDIKPEDSLLITNEGQTNFSIIQDAEIDESSEFVFTWQRLPTATQGPEELSITLEQVIKEFETPTGFTTRFGYMVNEFTALHEHEPINFFTPDEATELTGFDIAFIISLVLLTILIFAVGIQNIFKGKVEWRRALVIFLIFLLTFLGWRIIYYWSTFGDFLTTTSTTILMLNNILTGILIAAYGAMAYISWESFARAQGNGQVQLIDAFWQRRFLVKESGVAMISGLSIGGILLGTFALMLFLQDNFFIQQDSQFGIGEASNRMKSMTINMSAWSTSWLVGFAQVGFIFGIIKSWVKNNWIVLVAAAICTSIYITVLGRLVGVMGELNEQILIFVALGAIIVLAYKYYGMVTVNTAWWVFTSVILVIPYVSSQSVELASISWIQGGLILVTVIFGVIAYIYGISVSEVDEYIPVYEERVANQLRVEKEIEIARESQYQLMPVKPPVADGIDVHGFFLPSFEVGGDYYDYVLAHNSEGNAEALAMTVVDVSGKAMRAAMPAVFTSGLLLAKMKNQSPEQILTEVSEPIFNRTDKRTFITCAIARYDLKEKHMVVANAGHCKPILKRNGVADFIQTPDPKLPLGLKPDTQYGSHSFKLKSGDVFLLYSDGLPEAENDKGERFGFDEVPRLLESINTEQLSAQEIAHEIKRTIQKFSNYQLSDDTTVICLKV
ncbi:MAG: serine/threonine-protein phosphatase [Balneolales bacterium]|nr:serine/threonine-protein phosphatase [Balneolales bacterium]